MIVKSKLNRDAIKCSSMGQIGHRPLQRIAIAPVHWWTALTGPPGGCYHLRAIVKLLLSCGQTVPKLWTREYQAVNRLPVLWKRGSMHTELIFLPQSHVIQIKGTTVNHHHHGCKSIWQGGKKYAVFGNLHCLAFTVGRERACHRWCSSQRLKTRGRQER